MRFLRPRPSSCILFLLLGVSAFLFPQAEDAVRPDSTRSVRLLPDLASAPDEFRGDLAGFSESLRRRLELFDELDVVPPGASGGAASPRDIGLVLGTTSGEMGYELRLESGATSGRQRIDLSRPAEARSVILGAVLRELGREGEELGTVAILPQPEVADLIVIVGGAVFPAGHYTLAQIPAGRYQVEILEPRFGKLEKIYAETVAIEAGGVHTVGVAVPRFLPSEQARFTRLFTFVQDGMTGSVSYSMGETAAGMLLAYAEQSYNIPGLEPWRAEVRALATTFRVVGAYDAVLADYDDPRESSLYSADSLDAGSAGMPDPEVARKGVTSVYEAYAYLNALHAASAVARGDPAAARARYQSALAVDAKVSAGFSQRLQQEARVAVRLEERYSYLSQRPAFTWAHGAGLAGSVVSGAAAILASAASRDDLAVMSGAVSVGALVTSLGSWVSRATAPERLLERSLAEDFAGRRGTAESIIDAPRPPSTRTIRTLVSDYAEEP